MYYTLYTFLINNVTYNFSLVSSHTLINIAKNIRKALVDGNIACRAFVNLQKVFDTAVHHIPLAKLNHYGICGV